jgi:hypothetical protein
LSRNRRSAVTRHPNNGGFNSSIQLAAATVLLQEGVEGGKELGHGWETSCSSAYESTRLRSETRLRFEHGREAMGQPLEGGSFPSGMPGVLLQPR